MDENLPVLNSRESQCLFKYMIGKCSQIEAYSVAYGGNSNKNTLYKEASKFFHSPKILPWLNYWQKNTEKTIQEELNYTAKEHFDELNNLKSLALDCRDKLSNPDVKTMLKAEELKGKLAGFYNNNTDESVSQITVMNDIKLDGKTISLKVGSSVKDSETSSE